MDETTIEQAHQELLDEAAKFFVPGGHSVQFLISICRCFTTHLQGVVRDARQFPITEYLGIPIINPTIDKALTLCELDKKHPNSAPLSSILADLKGFLDNADLSRTVIGTGVDFSAVIRKDAVQALQEAGFGLLTASVAKKPSDEETEMLVFVVIGDALLQL